MTIEIFAFPPSPRAFKVMAVANHLDIDWTLRPLDMRNGAHKTAEYAAMNPNMRMPTLKDGAFVLWESNAISQYLAMKRPESGLLPNDQLARLDVTRWQFWDLAHWDQACAILIAEHVVKPLLIGGLQPDHAAVARGVEAFHRAAKVLNEQLHGRTYVCGEMLTLADFSLGAAMNLSELAHFPFDAYTEVKRWHAGLAALPSWQKTLKQSFASFPAARVA